MQAIWDNPTYRLAINITFSILAFIGVIIACGVLTSTMVVPGLRTVVNGRDYDGVKNTRIPLVDVSGYSPTAYMVNFQVATALFGGISTETGSVWSGTVSTEAAAQQVLAGARAIVLDIWPSPADRVTPVVCAMKDSSAWAMSYWWANHGGLNNKVGRYSNWDRTTRNTAPLADILKALVTSAFSGIQAYDPFFLIFRMHGPMSVTYLQTVGGIVNTALSGPGGNNGHVMPPAYAGCAQQSSIAKAPVNDFGSAACLIVIPDIEPKYSSPAVNTDYTTFTTSFIKTSLGEATNILEQSPNTVLFDPSSVSSVPNPVNGFYVVQPSTGGTSTNNSSLYGSSTSYATCMNSKAQFVAVNLLTPVGTDDTLTTFFSPSYFGTRSFIGGGLTG